MEFIYYDDIKTRRYSILMKAQHFDINLVIFVLRFILMSLTLNLIKDFFSEGIGSFDEEINQS